MATREARTRRAHFRRRTARAREATVAAATLRRSINRNRGLAAAPESARLGERSAPGHWLYCLAPPSELTENARELGGARMRLICSLCHHYPPRCVGSECRVLVRICGIEGRIGAARRSRLPGWPQAGAVRDRSM